MRLAGTPAAVRRIWTVELRSRAGGPSLVCPHCTVHATPLTAASTRSTALAHLACHARTDALPGYLRTCQCRARGCSWHPRHRGCAGPVLCSLSPATAAAAPGVSPTPAPLARAPPVTRPSSPPPCSLRAGPDAPGAGPRHRAARPNAPACGRCSPTWQQRSPSSPPPPPGSSPCSAPCVPTPVAMSGCPEASCAACDCAAARSRGRNWSRPGGCVVRDAGLLL
jgi:hypothetical protein